MAMSTVLVGKPSILHLLPGRVRIRVPSWYGNAKGEIETRLRQAKGVRKLQANTLTKNILIHFDPLITDEQRILEYINALEIDDINAKQEEAPASFPDTIVSRQGKGLRARIAVRGMEQDPLLARRVVEHLERRPGVSATANALTGRVLVEISESSETTIQELIADVTALEPADRSGEKPPIDPLDTGPLVQSIIRTAGITLGLGFLAMRRSMGMTGPLPGATGAFYVAAIVSIAQGIPPLRYGLRKVLGRTKADLLLNVPGIAALTGAQSPLGLATSGIEALRLLSSERQRRAGWKQHEERIAKAPSAQPDATIRLETGEQTPLAAFVLEGSGTAIGHDGMPFPVTPQTSVPPGSRFYGGPFLVRLNGKETFQPFEPSARPAPVKPTWMYYYQQSASFASLAYASLTALVTRSPALTFTSLLLVNARTAAVGQDSAELGAVARVTRAGATVVGTRRERVLRRPDRLLLDNSRLLTHGLELADVLLLRQDTSTNEALNYAASVSSATGSPWGRIFKEDNQLTAENGSFNGKIATAHIEGTAHTLGPVDDWSLVPEAGHLRQQGYYILVLSHMDEHKPVALFALQPRLVDGVVELAQFCQRKGIALEVISSGDQVALQALARRAQVTLLESDALNTIRSWQQTGEIVAYVADHAGAAAGFAACDLAIGLSDDRAHLPARADILAPDIQTITTILETTIQRDAAARDATGMSILSNIVCATLGLRGLHIGLSLAVSSIATIGAVLNGWWRLRGGAHAPSTITSLVDPRPERWGRQSVADVMRVINASPQGLTSEQAAERRQKAQSHTPRNRLFNLLFEQLNSPLTAIMAAGAGLSLLFGAVGDAVIIAGTILASVAINLWQERKVNSIAETLQRIGSTQARVWRDNQEVKIPASEVVPGDILLLASGDRVAADARVISAQGLEIDESALTGESLPVTKIAEGGTETNRIVLEGCDVTIGSGRAVVVAVGEQTRMGATRAALASDESVASPLGVRLGRMLQLSIPLSCVGGAIVIAAGLLWQQPLAAVLATGATIALAGVPEGLPLLAKIGETGVARRLAGEKALVRHLSAVEALGRVNVACADKTGTMTKGRLQLHLVADGRREQTLMADTAQLKAPLKHILLTAALASPHPDAPDAHAHPTDVAIVQGALRAEPGDTLHAPRERELPFDPMRSFHATVLHQRICLKGAPETLLPRCTSIRYDDTVYPLTAQEQQAMIDRSHQLAARGLRILLVAEGVANGSLEDPHDLTFLGFVGIVDPLRSTVRLAVNRCQNAGIRVIMITGDHPATAQAIAQEAGLFNGHGEVLTASELAELTTSELNRRLEKTVVVARATPLDKVRIIECLQRQGHTVAMTGDGVNDAPALRLANVGVAMGGGSTEVARQTADVVITDDDFSTLVEALVEGRSFWRNLRSALALLLGGNFAEVGLIVIASIIGVASPLTIRQIFAVNAMTDIFPALAVALQRPEHRNLAKLRREGEITLRQPLFQEALHRGIGTMLPALLSYLLTLSKGVPQARSVAFASFVVTQLIQTLDVSRVEGQLTRLVIGALVGSIAVLAAAFTFPPLRTFLNLVMPTPQGWLLVCCGAVVAILLKRLLALPQSRQLARN